jgi:hypothetical protein
MDLFPKVLQNDDPRDIPKVDNSSMAIIMVGAFFLFTCLGFTNNSVQARNRRLAERQGSYERVFECSE